MRAISLLLLLPTTVLAGTTYQLVKDISGEKFFDSWNFYGSFDNLTNGDAIFVTEQIASASKLAYVDAATSRAIVRVDNGTVVFNEKRNTVRLASKERFEVGSIWVTDMFHVPYGCSVWPAVWSQAPDWPTGGEIDTFEHWNMELHNQATLHTLDGCKQVSPVQSSTVINSTDCSFQQNSNAGCSVMNPDDASYGAKFAAAQGGIYVTEFAETGISTWFFTRANIPTAFSSNASTFSTDDLGTPVANWPTGGCDINKYFAAQNLIIDITLCGDAAGDATVFAQTCPGTCYTDYVVGNGNAYTNAYFDISYVRVYSVNGTNTIVSGGGAVPTTRASWVGWGVVLLAVLLL